MAAARKRQNSSLRIINLRKCGGNAYSIKNLPYTICRGSRKKARAAVGKIVNGGTVFACQKTAHAGRLRRVFNTTTGRRFGARASKTALPTAEGRKSRKRRRFSARQIFFQRGLRLSRQPAVPPLTSPPRLNTVCANRRPLLLSGREDCFPVAPVALTNGRRLCRPALGRKFVFEAAIVKMRKSAAAIQIPAAHEGSKRLFRQ